MKVCPRCNAKYDYDMSFCLQDGAPLQTLDVTQQQAPGAESDDKTLVLPASQVSQPTAISTPTMPPSSAKAQPTDPHLVNPTAQSPANRQPPPPPPTRSSSVGRKPRTGLLFAIPVMILALIGIAAGGAWWYLRNQEKSDLALTNSNKPREMVPSNNNSSFDALNNSNINSSNANAPENANNFNKSVFNSNAKPSPMVANTSKVTPTPENKTTPPTATPTPAKPTPKPEIENNVPPPPTPTPVPTPAMTPFVRPNMPRVVHIGVVNGKATRLVTPPYPPAARAVRASGTVNVRVLIDEDGNVILANAVSGHPLLRQSAESAARASKFSPTVLSGQPVKATGVIVYNFVAN